MKDIKSKKIIGLGIIVIAIIVFFALLNNEKEIKVVKEKISNSKNLVKEKEVLPKVKLPTPKTKKVEKVKEIKNPRGPVVYKNTPENEGYNMELNVPLQWSHLDYSRLGNPIETELPKEEWAAGDVLYSKGHPDYYKSGKKYFSAKAEEIVLNLFKDKELIKYIIDDDQKANEFFENNFDDVNKLIHVDEETGRKKYDEKILETISCVGVSFECDHGDWFRNANIRGLTDEEKNDVYRLLATRYVFWDNDKFYMARYNINKTSSDKSTKDRNNEFCKDKSNLDEGECWMMINDQRLKKYLK